MTEAKRPADVVQATISESAAIRRLNDAREKIVAQLAQVIVDFIEGDPLPIGIANNRKALETIGGFAHDQKITKQRYSPEEMFDKSTLNRS